MAPLLNLKARTVSDALAENPRSVDGNKLSLVGKCISQIGDLRRTRFDASQALLVTTLYLSNNSIDEIEFIGQFRLLRTLSLSNNLIRFTRNLLPLKDLAHLENLSLEGNPVCSMAYYREKTIHTCPSLVMLDACPVAQEERETVAAAVRKVHALEQQLNSNVCRIMVLEHLSHVIACHVELFQTVLAQFRVHRHPSLADVPPAMLQHPPAQVLKVASRSNVYRLVNEVSQGPSADGVSLVEKQTQNALFRAFAKHMRSMRPEVRAKLLQAHTQRRAMWDEVISECLQQQQCRIAELLEACELTRDPLCTALDVGVEQPLQAVDNEEESKAVQPVNAKQPPVGVSVPTKPSARPRFPEASQLSATQRTIIKQDQVSKHEEPPRSAAIPASVMGPSSAADSPLPKSDNSSSTNSIYALEPTTGLQRLTPGASLSGSLPPQQVEPTDVEPNYAVQPVCPPPVVLPPVVSTKPDLVVQLRRFLDELAERSTATVPSLQSLALHHNITQADLSLPLYKLPGHKRPPPNASMREVQVHLGVIYDEIDRFIPYLSGLQAAQTRIRKTAEKLRKKTSANVRSSLAHMEALGQLVKTNRDDVQAAKRWLAKTRSLSGALQRWRMLEQSRQEALAQLLVDIHATQQVQEQELERRARLQQAQLDGEDAIAEASQQFETPDFVAALKHREASVKALQYRTQGMHFTKRRWFNCLREAIQRRQRLLTFRNKVLRRKQQALARLALQHWLKYHNRQTTFLLVKSLTDLRQQSAAWTAWQQSHWRAHVQQQAIIRVWEGRLYRYFCRWVDAHHARRHPQPLRPDERLPLPSPAPAPNLELAPARAETLDSRADHFFLRSRFRAWQEVFTNSLVQFARLRRAVVGKVRRQCIATHFKLWRWEFLARQCEIRHQLRRGLRQLHHNRTIRHTQLMNTVHAVNTATDRRLRAAFGSWKDRALFASRRLRVVQTWQQQWRLRTLAGCLAVWISFREHRTGMIRGKAMSMEHYLSKLMLLGVRSWRRATGRAGACGKLVDVLHSAFRRKRLRGAWIRWTALARHTMQLEIAAAAERKDQLEQQLRRRRLCMQNYLQSWREYVRRRRFCRRRLGVVHAKVKRRRQQQVFRAMLEVFIKHTHGTRANRDLRGLEQQLAQLRERATVQQQAMQGTVARVNGVKQEISHRKHAIATADGKLAVLNTQASTLAAAIHDLQKRLAACSEQRTTTAAEIQAVSSLLLSTETIAPPQEAQAKQSEAATESHGATIDDVRNERAHLLQDLEWLHGRLIDAESKAQNLSHEHAEQLSDAIQVSRQFYRALEDSQLRVQEAAEQRATLAEELQRCHAMLHQALEHYHGSWEHQQREEELQSLDAEKEMLQSTLRVLEAEELSLLAELETRRKQTADGNMRNGEQDLETGATLASIEAKASSTAQAVATKEALRRWELESSRRDLKALQGGAILQQSASSEAATPKSNNERLRGALQRAMQATAQAIHNVHIENSVQLAAEDVLAVKRDGENLAFRASHHSEPNSDEENEEAVRHRILQRLRSSAPPVVSV